MIINRVKLSSLITLLIAALTASILALEITEHPLIRPFPGSVIDRARSEQLNFGEYEFRTGMSPRNYTTQTVRGEYRSLRYFFYNANGSIKRDVSQVEYLENFKKAALERGGTVKWEDQHYGLVFTIPREDGGTTWCRVQTSVSAGRTTLDIIDEQPLVTTLEFTPAEMLAALDADWQYSSLWHNLRL